MDLLRKPRLKIPIVIFPRSHSNGLLTDNTNSEVCHPRCVCKTNSEVNSARKHKYNYMLDDGIY